ncbi:MAG TPA: TonB-dependent receptor [Candidatus Acidoferrum sp.]|nr:TonB-dependent receptor [Candidatus Acidoferrum sp.]
MKRVRCEFLLLFLAVLSPVFVSAQNVSSDARVSGSITDGSGAGVAGVHVSAQNENEPKANVYKATSATDGAFSLLVPPGKYRLVLERSPFSTREFDVALSSSEQKTLDVKMELEPLSASVIVTAEAAPLEIQQTTAPVETITKAEIEERLLRTLPDALLTSTAVSIGRTGSEGGTASVFLGGGNSSFTKVLVDGTPVNEPGNAVDFSNFTLDNVDKVEIVRGAESAIYGTDAVSGVVQVITHHGTTRTPEVTLFGEGGTFATGRGGAQLSGLLGNFDYSAAGSYFGTDGPDNENAFYNRTLSGNFGYRISEDNQIRLTLRNNTSNAQTPGQTLLEPANLDAHTDYQFFSSNLRWDFATGQHWHHQLSGAESYNREFIADPIQSFFATDPLAHCQQDTNAPNAVPTAEFCDFPGISRNRFNRSSLNAQSSFLLPNFAATGGYQYEVENATLQFTPVVSSPPLGPHLRRNNQGGFLDFRYSPHRRATISFGGRAESNAVFGTRVVPRAGASLALLQGRDFWGETRLRVFYGEGIKEARFDQTSGTDPCFPGNPQLKPESSKTWSVGIDQKLWDNRARVGVEYFANQFYDIVSFEFLAATAACPGGTGSFFNTDLARARGVNLTSEIAPARWIRFIGKYTHDDSRVLKSPNALDPALVPGNHLLRRPVDEGSLSIVSAFRKWTASATGYFTVQRTDTDFLGLGLTRTAGYARFDISSSYDFSRAINGYLRVQNLFDKQYQDALGYPALGREVRVGMKYRFGGKG